MAGESIVLPSPLAPNALTLNAPLAPAPIAGPVVGSGGSPAPVAMFRHPTIAAIRKIETPIPQMLRCMMWQSSAGAVIISLKPPRAFHPPGRSFHATVDDQTRDLDPGPVRLLRADMHPVPRR